MRRQDMPENLVWDNRSIFWYREASLFPNLRNSELWMMAEDLSREIWGQIDDLSNRHGSERESSVFFENW